MTGGDHDSAVKIIGSCHIGNGWGCGYMKQVCICPGSYQTTYQCVFKHIAGSPGIFSDDDPCRCIIPVSAFLFSVVPAQESADFVCVVCSQVFIGFSTEAIRSKIFTHFSFFPS